VNLIEKFDQANRIYSLYAAQIPRYFKKNIKVKNKACSTSKRAVND
tara:strand:+ start:34 stop:171 length:138 start_codon:yes stop_codon:yes gene_type:complete